jgi:2-dehydropantoate 2-reductase
VTCDSHDILQVHAMHFHVLGLGPVGCLLAHNLRRILPSAHGISLILKSGFAVPEKCSIKVDNYGGATTFSDGFLSEEFRDAQLQENQPQNSKQIQSLFVALKAQYTVDALRSLTYRLSANSTIVLMQNGMGLYEELIRDVFRNPSQRPHFIQASNTNGAFAIQPLHVVHAGIGSIDFGIVPDSRGRNFEAGFNDDSIPHSERRLRLSDITSSSDVDSARYTSLRDTVAALLLLEPLSTSWKTYSELQLIIRRKLAVNAVINPLTALLGCRNGQLMNLPPRSRIMALLCWETSLVFAAEMRRESTLWLEDMQSRGVDTKDVTIPSLPKSLSPSSLEEEVTRVAQLTRNNVSSMLQDVRRGRITEIYYINGYLAKLGRELGVRTPYNIALRELVSLRHVIPLDQIL